MRQPIILNPLDIEWTSTPTSLAPSICKKLKGGDNEWRIRVGDYRVVYIIDDANLLVEVTRIRHRLGVYER